MAERKSNNRAGAAPGPPWTTDPRTLRPMLAVLQDAPLDDVGCFYEPKYDGIRALALVDAAVCLLSRQGNDKTSQFPEVRDAVAAFGQALGRPVVLDGEIVAVGPDGAPRGFEALQGRMHLARPADALAAARRQPAAFVVFDLLRDGAEDLRPLPFETRRSRLEALLAGRRSSVLRLGLSQRGRGAEVLAEVERSRGEGIVVKRAECPYESGRRTPAFRKIKLARRQELVVGGYTAPRGSRGQFGALLLGVPAPGGRLRYAGHVGTGFDQRTLEAIARRMKPLETKTCPFTETPPSNERPVWVRPELVAEVRFTEWTTAGILRHPVFLGLREDIEPTAVVREEAPLESADAGIAAVLRRLEEAEHGIGKTRLILPGEVALDVTNLGKPYWPGLGITKGELLRYYLRVSGAILPVVRDRPLVMKRHPEGIDGEAFYQHRAPDKVPSGVRVEAVEEDGETMRMLVGGELATLLYMVQLGTISQDPWFSRVGDDDVSEVAFDLDPMEGVGWDQVIDVALAVRDELERIGVVGFPKTSGASGLHVFVPLAPGTPYEAGRLFTQIVAAMVVARLPKIATVERAVAARGRTVYVDCLQNIRGKTLACAYSARASAFAGASAPLSWSEVEARVRPEVFTIRTLPARLARVGDLWAPTRDAGSRVDLGEALERLKVRAPRGDRRGPKSV